MKRKNILAVKASIVINRILLCLSIIIVPSQLQAKITLPGFFSDNMMFQRNQEIVVWGWADTMEQIRISFNKKKYTTTTKHNGTWEFKIPAMQAGGPYEMAITGQDSIKISNILIGDIWICSGQSNMAMPVQKANDSEKEITKAKFRTIRLFRAYENMAATPQEDITGEGWMECNPESIAQFSAVGYFFGRELIHEMGVPIGLIESSWGGSVIETWISKEGFKGDSALYSIAESVQFIDMEEENRTKNIAYNNWIEDFRSRDEGVKNGEYLWTSGGSNYCDWNSMRIPANWEKRLGNLNGIVWFRKTFELTLRQADGNALISLGPISNTDITWVNGEEVGEVYDIYNKLRKYIIPPGILRHGKNEIVVRVENYKWDGGIYGTENQVYLLTNNDKIPLAGEWKYKIGAVAKEPRQRKKFNLNSFPGLLYNAMISPFIKLPVKGVIWYQGESNKKNACQYRNLFKRLINDWRQKWGIGDFPFLFAQLPNYLEPVDSPAESEWAVMRESQDMALSLPNTGMACIIDLGETYNIHPKNKQGVGRRLALAALKVAYGKNIVYSGPRFEKAEIKGGKVITTFTHVGEGLQIKDKYGYLKGFTIAGKDKIFKWAKAELVNENTVSVHSHDLKEPVAVRYGWANNPNQANLYNNAGLPTNPFRTDRWEVITINTK